jgi:hypothetical protein
MAKFAEVIECLKNGGKAQRIAWDVTGDKEIMMQIPQRIAKDIVPKMTSVQDIVKSKISTVGSGEIEYHHQVIIIEFKDDEKTPARATYYIPTWEDIMADDWRLTQPANSYIARMVNEREELSDKAEKLNKFFSSSIFNGLPDNKKELMERQYKLMVEYVEVLDERVKLENTTQG